MAVRIWCVGDVYLNGGDNSPFKAFEQSMNAADFRVCNYEAPFTSVEDPVPGRLVPLRSPTSAVGELTSARIDLVSLANNHVLDYGYAGLRDTINTLDRNKVLHVGAGSDETAARKPEILAANGTRVAFLGYACSFPYGYASDGNIPGLAAIRVDTSYIPAPYYARAIEHPGTEASVQTTVQATDIARATEDVRAAASVAEHVVINIHWGVPGVEQLHGYQRQIAHALVDAGATVVIGHHAHVLQAVEQYQGSLILYGLSHFIFDLSHQSLAKGTQAVAATMTLDGGEVQDAALIAGQFRPLKGPTLCDPEGVGALSEHMGKLSANFGTRFEQDRSGAVGIVAG